MTAPEKRNGSGEMQRADESSDPSAASPRSEASARVALITGAGKRVGAAIARHLHHRGLSVAVHYRRSADSANALVRDLDDVRPGSAAAFEGDLVEPSIPARIVDKTVERFGALDLLINNASAFYPTPVGGADEDQWNELMGTNLKAPYFLTQAAAPFLAARQGSIVNLVDIHGRAPIPDHSIYCAAKAGLIMLTRALALDLGPSVRVNAVAPGIVLWPQTETPQAQAQEEEAAEQRRRILESVPLRRQGTVLEVAMAVAWLALDAPYTTGQIIAVDGGRGIGGAPC
ncbi:pteridine reductase [Thioalkalivibrio sp. HK1]|uniref:pteridine reductase n=1 Tax=Thioalkalivibrio sp. HK1 TaxID=1469245 RepID=UPI00047083D6|nr:pteridine reductase [Thioalkalivibrio sp. HK1]